MDLLLKERFEQILTREAQSVNGLVTTLEQEYEALKQNDAESLNKVVAIKQQQLETLNTLSDERAKLLRDNGFAADRNGLSEALKADSSEALSSIWESIEEALQKCQQQNELNGKLLDVSKQQTEQLLSLMLGKEANASAGLYDEHGNTSSSYNRNTSIKV